MHNAWLHRHGDGSIHYTHCCTEAVECLPAFERPDLPRKAGARLRAAAGAAVAALGLATVAFWITMLSTPPVSRAALPPKADLCWTAGHAVRTAIDAEVARRARIGSAPGQAEFNGLLLWTRSAESACAAGRTREALREFKALEQMIAARSVRHEPEED
ncbi:hypothetical protein [Methylobacterium nodulans]|uniref:Uncharacterized protein n=1 Tax=Methylobacterium nodulans (strain LMG 21967 / CNCM I-2342 / ORS 2060) TaxID=460265 RepID=B8IDD2_METNO|nr:hypothetical protein [Methylobacterium nodulans]ACL61298.1 hypothetical protein Mnod_6529 [Methylobacterium nodulans ORS 2060]